MKVAEKNTGSLCLLNKWCPKTRQGWRMLMRCCFRHTRLIEAHKRPSVLNGFKGTISVTIYLNLSKLLCMVGLLCCPSVINGFTFDLYKSLFHAKLKMLSFTHLHFILNLYYFLLWNKTLDRTSALLPYNDQHKG